MQSALDLGEAVAALTPYAKGDPTVEQHTRRITVPVSGGARVLADVIRELDARGIVIHDIGLRRPTLDDVFLALTGHATEAEEGEPDGIAEETAAGDTKDSAKDSAKDGTKDGADDSAPAEARRES